MADQILKALIGIDGTDSAGAGGSGGGGGGGAGVADAAGAPANAATAGATPAAAAQQAGQMGQMMGMPMQMASAGCPDTNAIGGHGGVDSAGNHAGRAERDAAGRPNGRRRRGRDRSGVGSTGRRVTGRGEARRIRDQREGSAVDSFRWCRGTEQCGTGTGDGPQPAPDVPQQPHKPAPTRPATSGPESVL